MKSLDRLIRFLLDEIALCGDYGASVADFKHYVNTYYKSDSFTDEGESSSLHGTNLVDRKFLDKVWGWLTQHPEIQVGKDSKATRLSLLEVESQNAQIAQHKTLPDDNSPTLPAYKTSKPPKPSARRRKKQSMGPSSAAQNEGLADRPPAEIRVYASIERRWQAIAGHAVDPVKIPALDFVCLSIIAAHREQGILQPELVRISGQDKRSVPQRTQRLMDGGYISKVPILVNRSHTSRMTLKRYIKEPPNHVANTETANSADLGSLKEGNSVENSVDFLALRRRIFDILREARLIAFSELKDKIGVTGLKWPMRLLATQLRRLERIGCIKQVRAHPNTETPSPFLFRCVKYIRDPEGREWNPVNFPSRYRPKPAIVLNNEPDASSDEEQDYLAAEEQYLARFGGRQQLESLQEVERPIPQWSGDSTLSNLLYDLAHAAGLQGISTMELKDRSMGPFTGRPVEIHISKLVEMWQLSQPLHLRYLSIIRDSALTDGIPHYIHYSFENFTRLVAQGKASWDAVMTITKEHRKFTDAATIDAEPDLDENGFPKITESLFQGRHNDANLAECVQNASVKLPSLSSHDPRVVQTEDGGWLLERRDLMQGPRGGRPKRSSFSSKAEALPRIPTRRLHAPNILPNLVVAYSVGRDRKVQADGLPAGFEQMPVKQRREILRSQRAAKLYKKQKLIKEIEKRVQGGTDLYEATAAVFVLAIQQYRDAQQAPPWDMMDEIRIDTLAPLLRALQRLCQDPSLNTASRYNEKKTKAISFRPSAAAHSRPLRTSEERFVDGILRFRIQIIRDVPIEHGTHEAELQVLSETMHQPAMTGSLPKPKPRRGRPPRGKDVAAHTFSLVSHDSTHEEPTSLKRKRSSDGWTPSKRPQRVPKKKAPFEPRVFGRSASIEASSRHVPTTRSYQQQLDGILRPTAGFYVGQEVKLPQPGKGGHKRKGRLAVIKSARLQDLLCCLTEELVIEPLPPQSDQHRLGQLQKGVGSALGINQDSIIIHAPDTRPLTPNFVSEAATDISKRILATASHSVQAPSFTPGAKDSSRTKRKRSVNKKGRNHRLTPDAASINLISPQAFTTIDDGSANEIGFSTSRELENSPLETMHGSFPPLNVQSPARSSELSKIREVSDRARQLPEALGSPTPPDGFSQSFGERLDVDGSTGKNFDRRHLAPTGNTQEKLPNPGHASPGRASPSESPELQPPLTSCDTEPPRPAHQLDHHDRAMDRFQPEGVELAISDQALIQVESGMPEGCASVRPLQELEATSVGDSVAHVTVVQPPAKSGVRKVKLGGGTIAARRRKIVMDIVEKCEGIYPGVFELGAPFKDAWLKYGYLGRPDTSTLKAAVKALCDNGTLRQLTFSFKDTRGILVTKTMITKVEISPTDPKVLEMQNTIIGMHPHTYIPQELEMPDDVREAFRRTKGYAKMRTVKDLEVDENQVQLNRVPAYVENYELRRKSREHRKAQEERQLAVFRELMASGKLPQEAVDDTLGAIDTVDARKRLLSLAKRSMLKKPQRKVDRLASLKQTSTSQPLKLTDGNIASAYRKVSGNQSRVRFKEHFQEVTRQRLAELQQERRYQGSKQLDFSRLLTTNNFESNLAALLLEEELRQAEMDTTPASIESYSPTRGHPGRAPRWRYGTSKPVDGAELEKNCVMTFQLSGNALIRRRNSLGSDSHSPEARQQLYTIMEPEHFFHPATGTFAVNFSRWRTVDQIVERYHWQRPPVKDFRDFVDDLMVCELNTKGLEDAEFSDWPHVNYTFPHHHRTAKYQGHSTEALWYSKICGSRGYEQTDGIDPLAARIPAKRKRSAFEPFKTRRLTTVAKLSQLANSRATGDDSHTPQRRITKRRERALTVDEIRKVLIAVIVVRTLTGGVERHIDWVLVTKVFEPEFEQAYIQHKWPKVLQAHRLQAEQLQANFQALFLQAYKEGLVPPLDYDNLQAYDWAWLVNWTIENIDIPIGGALDLPSQRSRLNNMFQLGTGEDSNLHEYYEFIAGSSALNRREMDLHKRAWVQSLTNDAKEIPEEGVSNLELAKTWIRANIATKAESYNPQFARDKLAQFDPNVIDQALKELLGDRILMTENKGRLIPGRNYDLSENFLKPLKRRVEAGRFSNAPRIKQEIDAALAEKGELIVSELADDTFMIAMQNMQAQGRISLVAKNPPMKEFGLTDNGSYKVRTMDKRRLHFDVAILATDSYVEGNPLLPLPGPPSSHSGSSMGMIPLWYDINGDLIVELWNLAVAATMSVLVMRPGITARVLEPTVRPSLGLWEVQMLLDWMVEARAAKKTDGIYTPQEWWWLCLDTGTTEDDAPEKEQTPEVLESRRDVEMGDNLSVIMGHPFGVCG